MQVYRVYESYHEPDESGTTEYGIFSTRERAFNRAREAWAKVHPTLEPSEGEYGLFHNGAWDWTSIGVDRFELDAPVTEDRCGYT